MFRRKRERAPRFNRDVAVRIVTTRARSEGQLLNISSTGALLRLSMSVREGARVRLIFPATAPGMGLPAKVVRIATAAASIHDLVALRFFPESDFDRQLIRGVIYNKKVSVVLPYLNFNGAKLQNIAVILSLIIKIGFYVVLPIFLLLGLLA